MTRISIGPGEVAGYFASLKSGFDELGIESEHFLLSPSKYAYKEHGHFLSGASRLALKMRSNRNRLVRLIGVAYALIVRICIFAYALARYDVFIFCGSWSFFNFLELPILKAFNKKIIVVFLGSDARPPIFCGRHLDDEGGLVDPVSAQVETRQIYNKIRRIERYADHIINHTATDQFFTKDYIRFAAIGLPVQLIEQQAVSEKTDHVKIVHAPSRPIAKGTPVFRKVIEELRQEGYAIDFRELVGVSNQTVLDELANCDFILDELYSDTPMAMLATEAAMLGKPTIVGGYYAADYPKHNPDVHMPPSLFVRPSDIKDAIRRMIEDREFRLSLGSQARDFVCEQWNASAVAQRFHIIIEGNAPSYWVSQPQDNCYLWGWGLSEQAWHQQIRRYINYNGFDALLLAHNKALSDKIKAQLVAAEGSSSCS